MQALRALFTRTPLRSLALPGLVLAGIISMPLAAEAPAASHDLYNPTRTALVNAQRQLAESARLEQDMLQRVQRMNTELDSSLALLTSAAQLDPSMKAQIDAVRSRLAALQGTPGLCPMGSSSSLTVYNELLADLEGLIKSY